MPHQSADGWWWAAWLTGLLVNYASTFHGVGETLTSLRTNAWVHSWQSAARPTAHDRYIAA